MQQLQREHVYTPRLPGWAPHPGIVFLVLEDIDAEDIV